MKNGKVSVIVPVYNVEEYVGECIESIINQTYTNLEILINNDGSTDNSYEICKSYAEKDNRIRLFSQENKGLSAARNAMIEKVSGDYVLFVDSDDKIALTYAERLVHALESNDARAVACKYIRWGRKKSIDNRRQRTKSVKAKKILSSENIAYFFSFLFGLRCAAWCKLLRKEDVKHLTFPVGRYYEDMMVMPKFMSDLGSIIYLPEKLYLYRQRNGSIMHTSFNIAKTDELDAYIGIVKLGAQLGSMRIARHGMLYFFTMYNIDLIKMYLSKINTSNVKKKYVPFIVLFRKHFMDKKISPDLITIEIPDALRNL